MYNKNVNMKTLKILKIVNKYSKEQNLDVKSLGQMQHVCAIKNLRSAIFFNFRNTTTVAICIECKTVGNTQTLNSTSKAATSTNLGQHVMC